MANNLLECPPIGSRSGERPRKESATLSELEHLVLVRLQKGTAKGAFEA